jgi:hypothetical protein
MPAESVAVTIARAGVPQMMVVETPDDTCTFEKLVSGRVSVSVSAAAGATSALKLKRAEAANAVNTRGRRVIPDILALSWKPHAKAAQLNSFHGFTMTKSIFFRQRPYVIGDCGRCVNPAIVI